MAQPAAGVRLARAATTSAYSALRPTASFASIASRMVRNQPTPENQTLVDQRLCSENDRKGEALGVFGLGFGGVDRCAGRRWRR